MPVILRLLIDSADRDGLLYGPAVDPNGGAGGVWRRGYFVREFAPGFEAGFLTWVRAEGIRR